MKKSTIIYFLISFIVLAALLTLMISSFPKVIDKTFDAVKYSTNSEKADYMEKISVTFKGQYTDSLFGHHFKGDLYINNVMLNQSNMKIDITFNSYNMGPIFIPEFSSSAQIYETNSLGTLFINKNFSSIYITLNGEEELAIAGPAHTREEAVATRGLLQEN